MARRLFLVDGSNHAFRVQFALPPRHTADGFPTRVLYGFTLLFQKMMRTWRPDHVVVSFDTGRNFREDVFADYKGHRPEMPDDLRQQWPHLPELVEAFGYRAISVEGYEADDVLGTFARRFPDEDLEIYFVTSDKDFAQLVDDRTFLLDEGKGGAVLGPSEVEEKFGIGPQNIIDMLALAGDKSDNVPGVEGVGNKTAVKFLKAHGDLEGVLAAAARGEIKGKTGQRLVEQADNARLSQRLVTIHTQVPVSESLEDLAPRPLDEARVRELFDRWEFGTVARKLLPDRDTLSLSEVKEVGADSLDDALAAIRGGAYRWVAVTTTPHDDTPWAEDPVAVAFLDEDGAGFAFDLTGPQRASVFALLADPAVPKILHDAKSVYRAMLARGGALRGVVGDTRLLDYVLTPHRRQHGLQDLASRQLGHTLGTAASAVDLPEGLAQAAEHATLVRALDKDLRPRLDPPRTSVYEDIELPLTPVLAMMEHHGILLDTDRIQAIDAELAERLEQLEARCHELAGRPFSVRSRKEVGAVLFDELGLPPGKKVTGGYSTASSVLEGLLGMHELPGAILDYRSLDKLRGTYLTKLPEYVGPDGRIHTTLHQAVAQTGRLSSVDPNLQNIPVRSFEGRRIRDCFIPDDGFVFLSADYSQVELRVLAHFSQDPVLIEGFRSGQDIHARTAVELFHADPDDVGVEQRSAAKAINFGLIYGMSAFRLARELQIPREEAQAHMDRYFERMPKVRDWIEGVKEQVRRDGQVETLYGRRRTIPEIHSNQFNERSAAEREAVNTCIQGTAADLIKRAMIRVAAALDERGSGARMLLQVHDELLLEVPESEIEDVKAWVSQEMQAAGELAVDLVVNTSVGKTWNEAHG